MPCFYNGIFRVFPFLHTTCPGIGEISHGPPNDHSPGKLLGEDWGGHVILSSLAGGWRYAAGQVVCCSWAVSATISVPFHLLIATSALWIMLLI